MIAKLQSFIEETKAELIKATWPSREDTIKLTRTVIIISIIISVYLGLLDYVFNEILNKVVSGI